MGRICVLSDELASQVAAGEVVERPASIVKELCENSLDAGARRISVEFAQGGSRLISVQDDGCGMDAADAALCIERHATSKLRNAHGLSTVRTMGFRGEALPSMASVSRFRLVTRPPEAEAGTEVIVTGGRLESVRDAGAPPGTLVEIRDLFFNIPARRKFLRGEETEAARILHAIHGTALSAFSTGMECRRDGRVLFQLPPAQSLGVRLNDLFGREFLDRLQPLPAFEGEGFEVSGFLARPGAGRRDRHQQWVILNGRPIMCPEASQALREAYAGALPAGQHPMAVLQIKMDPTLVDCNVHPAKRVVRFARPEAVRRGIYDAAQGILRSVVSAAAPSQPMPPEEPRPQSQPPPKIFPQTTPPPAEPILPGIPKGASSDPLPDHPSEGTADSSFHILGRLGAHLFLFEGPEGLVILDTRGARERIAFERLLRGIESGQAPIQRLLLPEVVELPVREYAWILDHREALAEAGFLIEPFGASTLKIEGVPALGSGLPPASLLHTVAASMRDAGRLPRGHGLREVLARSVCGAALGPPPALTPDEAERLLRNLLACELPYAAPGGQPTLIQFSFAELDRKFGRFN